MHEAAAPISSAGSRWLTARAVVGVLLCALVSPLHAGLHFDHLTAADGLVQNTVYTVIQDQDGYIWLGTEDGLHRYDGYRIDVFQHDPDDPTSLTENFINDLELSADGSIWIATLGGLDRLDPDTGEFEHFTAADGTLSDDNVWSVIEDGQGRIWVGTNEGLDRIDPDSGEVVHYDRDAEEGRRLSNDIVWRLFEDSHGTVWIGTNAGLNRYDPESDIVTAFELEGEEGEWIREWSVNTFLEDREGRLWVGLQGALLALDAERELLRSFDPEAEDSTLSDGRVFALAEDEQGDLWIGTYGGGLLRYEEGEDRFEASRHDPTDRRSLGSDRIYDMFVDRTGLIWIGTESGGVDTFDPSTRAFNHYRHRPGDDTTLSNDIVWAMAEGPEGRLWVGSEGGISVLDRETGTFDQHRHDPDDEDSLPSDYMSSFHLGPTGTMWIGHDWGISRYLGDGRFETTTFDAGEDAEYIEEIELNYALGLLERDGILWVGTGRGLVRMDVASGEYEHLPPATEVEGGLPGPGIYTVRSADDGGLWLGTDAGLVHFDPETGEHWSIDSEGPAGQSLSHDWVQSLLVHDGKLWLGTGYGLSRVDPETREVTNLSTEDGLPNNTVYGIVADDRGHLWLSTNTGLADYDPTTGEFRNYDVSDGLQSDEFNSGAYGRTADGEVFFGGIEGFNIFDPEELMPNRNRPRVAITRFFLSNEEQEFGKPLEELEEIVLDHTQNVFSVEFIAFDFAAPDRNRFQFKLEGFDPDWRSEEDSHRATYTNLDAGDYLFRVKGSNKDGIWSEQDATLAIRVEPPPWQTPWAYALYALALILATYLFFAFQRQRLLRENQFRTEQQRRHWAETMHQLTRAMAATLDTDEIASELLNSLQRMVRFEQAALFVEQGTETDLVATRGMTESARARLELLPETHAQRFANLRHSRRPTRIDPGSLQGTPLVEDGEGPDEWFAVPMFSRAEEFALLIVGRRGAAFEEQDLEVASAFAKQAMVALENARLFAEVQNLATTDSLTRLHNRRYFLELAELEFTRSRRYQRELSILLLDADHFKEVNDTYGHEVGDRVLKIIANICRTNLRHFDIVGRYGGEEFIVLLPETTSDVAIDVADRIRMSVENVSVSTHKGDLKVTVSMGVASLDDDTADLAALINTADGALYEAKRGGRNRVVGASGNG